MRLVFALALLTACGSNDPSPSPTSVPATATVSVSVSVSVSVPVPATATATVSATATAPTHRSRRTRARTLALASLAPSTVVAQPAPSLSPPSLTPPLARAALADAPSRELDDDDYAAATAAGPDFRSLSGIFTPSRSPRRRALDYGLSLDVGVPDGATLALALRPRPSLRFDAGISYNGISYGARGGVTFAPLTALAPHATPASWLTPTVSFDYGHFGDGDANPLARLVTGNPMFESPTLERVGYDYADAHVGLELGRTSFVFYVHAGASRITGAVHDLDAVGTGSGGKMSPITFGNDPTVTLTMLSARIGCIYYFAN